MYCIYFAAADTRIILSSLSLGTSHTDHDLCDKVIQLQLGALRHSMVD